MSEPIWIEADQAIAIARLSAARFGGFSGEISDENLFKAAMGRPLNKWHYGDPKPSLFDLAAAYCFAICRGQVFHDGNKRAGYIVAMVFLDINGITCVPDQIHIIETILKLAAGEIDEVDLAKWFENNASA